MDLIRSDFAYFGTGSGKQLWNSYSRLSSQIYPCLFRLIGSYPCMCFTQPSIIIVKELYEVSLASIIQAESQCHCIFSYPACFLLQRDKFQALCLASTQVLYPGIFMPQSVFSTVFTAVFLARVILVGHTYCYFAIA